MIFDLTIAGVPKQLKAGTLNIHALANGRATASFRIDSQDRSYRPAIDAEVVMEEDGVRIFGGLIDRPAEKGFAGPRRPGISTTVNAVDYHVYAEWRYVNETLAAGTLKSQLTTLVTNYLAVFGVSLDAGQVDGPSLPELILDYVRLDEVLNQLMALTADFGQPYIWRISNTKVLSAYQPSTTAAPFNLIGDTLPEVVGDIEVEPSNDGKANKIIVKVIPVTEMNRVESFTGNGVDDFVTLQYTLTQHRGYVTYNGIFETLTTTPFAGTASWTYDAATNTLTREAGPIGNGLVVSITFDGVFSGTWTATDPSWTTSPREKVIELETIPTTTTGQAFADAELAKSLEGPIFVRYHTWEQGVVPGQSQTINVPSRNVNNDAVITEVVITDKVHRLDRYVTAVADDTQTNLDRGWTDVYRIWAGDKTGSGTTGTSIGSGAVGVTGPAPPTRSVQFNDSGSFGGDSAFIYYKDENSVVCGGGGTSINATTFESCQAFGYDCHIG